MKKSEIKLSMQVMVKDKKDSLYGCLGVVEFINKTIRVGIVSPNPSNIKTAVFVPSQLIERDPYFYKLNKSLYESLLHLWEAGRDNGGSIDYPSNDFGWISDTLDFLAIKYFGETPDGDEQERNFKSGDPFLTDKEAYEEILTRFNNTRI